MFLKIATACALSTVLTMAAGCASAPGTSPTQAPPGGPTASATAGDVLPVDYVRSGGITGRSDRLRITAEGVVTTSHDAAADDGPRVLDPEQLAKLNQVLSAVDAATAPPSSAVCADGYQYRISTPSWTIITDDCATGAPALDRALALLSSVLKDSASTTASPVATR